MQQNFLLESTVEKKPKRIKALDESKKIQRSK